MALFAKTDIQFALHQLNFNNKYGFKKLKPKQMDIIVHLVNRRNVFAVLPTGYWKKLCFGLPSLILDKLETHRRHICLVISPLRSLMMNQVQAWSKKGISSAIWGRKEEMDDSVKTEITKGNISIVFSSPESILSPAGLDLLRSKEYKEGLCLIAFDEVHCITEWVDDFRPKYKEVSLLRSLASNVPVGMFTATCTEKIMEDVLSHLLLNNKPVESEALLPDRPNLMLNIKKASQFEKEIDWYITNLKTNGQKAPKAIIYCRSMTHAAEIYAHILHSIGEAAWLNIDKHDPCRRLVDVYHRSSLPEDQHRVTTEFPKEDSVIRCIIATISFGMGVDIDDIRYIFHWGCSKSPLSYWQEIGRCSRDGQLGRCFLYFPPHVLDPRRVDESMIAICKDNSLCIRRELLQHLVITGMDITELKDMKFRASCSKNCTNCKCSLCMCCSRCKEQCNCQLTTI